MLLLQHVAHGRITFNPTQKVVVFIAQHKAPVQFTGSNLAFITTSFQRSTSAR